MSIHKKFIQEMLESIRNFFDIEESMKEDLTIQHQEASKQDLNEGSGGYISVDRAKAMEQNLKIVKTLTLPIVKKNLDN